MSRERVRVACYMARRHGLAGLRALLADDAFEVVGILTHRRKATFEDPERGERPDHADFVALAAAHDVPLHDVDARRDRDALPALLASLHPDVLAVISWRYLITPAEIAQARLGGVNVHRGRVPDYAGNIPLQRALEAGEETITVTALELAEGIDEGAVLATAEHPVGRGADESIPQAVERLKREIEPLFGPLLLEGLRRHLAARG